MTKLLCCGLLTSALFAPLALADKPDVPVIKNWQKQASNCTIIGEAKTATDTTRNLRGNAKVAVGKAQVLASEAGGNAVMIISLKSDSYQTRIHAELLKCSAASLAELASIQVATSSLQHV
ncbi:MAG: hypothetical protein V7711_05490 [Pseudomonadales bacterium]